MVEGLPTNPMKVETLGDLLQIGYLSMSILNNTRGKSMIGGLCNREGIPLLCFMGRYLGCLVCWYN